MAGVSWVIWDWIEDLRMLRGRSGTSKINTYQSEIQRFAEKKKCG
jgi:hypothetical protein